MVYHCAHGRRKLMSNDASGGVIDAANRGILHDMISAAHDVSIPGFMLPACGWTMRSQWMRKLGSMCSIFFGGEWSIFREIRPLSLNLRSLAERAHRKVSGLLKASIDDLELTIRTAFGKVAKEAQIKGATFIINGSAILGALFDTLWPPVPHRSLRPCWLT